MDLFTHQGEYISNLTDKLSGGITDCPMAISERDLGFRPEPNTSKPAQRPAPIIYDRVAEAARRSHYFMGRRPTPIKTIQVEITDEEYRRGGSALLKFRHFMKGAIYMSSRRPGGGSSKKAA
jgi:hypothetical protein